jgi:hypothetical protein
MGTYADFTIKGDGHSVDYWISSDGHPETLADGLADLLRDVPIETILADRAVLVGALQDLYGFVGGNPARGHRFSQGYGGGEFTYIIDLDTGTIAATGMRSPFLGTLGAFVARFARA